MTGELDGAFIDPFGAPGVVGSKIEGAIVRKGINVRNGDGALVVAPERGQSSGAAAIVSVLSCIIKNSYVRSKDSAKKKTLTCSNSINWPI